MIYTRGGNGWFWDPDIPTADLMTVSAIQGDLEYLEPRWCAYILNCPPSTEGLLDANIVSRLAETGRVWSPDLNRPPLPKQNPQIQTFIVPESASATSGNAMEAIDGKNDRYFQQSKKIIMLQ